MEVMSPLDSAFLRMESSTTSLSIASVAVFEGPAPSYDELADFLTRKLADLPRYRQRVREVPLWLGRPVWVDAAEFDMRHHLRHTALPRPGGAEELRALVGRVLSQQLERSRPLWEDWLVEGLEGGQWALVTKVHHCMVDGVAGTDLLTRVLDNSPDEIAGSRAPWPQPAAEPGPAQLIGSAIAAMPRNPLTVARRAADSARHPRRALKDAAVVGRGLLSWARLAVPAEPSSLTGPLGRSRLWDFTQTTFDDIHVVRSAHGGTVNDVVLAAITRGFRDLLLSRGETPGEHVVRTLIPVSVRGSGTANRTDNEVSAMIAELPVGETDPVTRLQAVRAEMDRLKHSGEIEVGELLTEAGGWTAPMLLAVGLTGASRLPHRHLVTVATNVPGPRIPLYVMGRRLISLYPFVPIANRVRIGVAMTSYDRVLTFGLTADAASTPDLDVLTAGITQGMRELVEISSGPRRRTPVKSGS